MLRRGGSPRRLLTTVLFTDIVGSTERAAQLGDRAWKDLVARHHAIVRHQLRSFHGRELDTAGDGFFASFRQPAEAIECATRIVDDLAAIGLTIRAAIHMGEAEVMGGKVGGLTVHVASRALGQAGPGEILVTRTVREVAAGAGVSFSERGLHEFKGVPGSWDLYAVGWQRAEQGSLEETGSGTTQVAARAGSGWRMLALASLFGVGIVGLAAYSLVGRGSAAPPPVAQPDSAIRIDAATGAVRAVVGTDPGSDPTGIAAADDTVWVVSLSNALLTAIPADGTAPTRIGLPGTPTAIAAGYGSVWVAFRFGLSGQTEGVVLPVSTTTKKKEPMIQVGSGATAIAVDESGVWVANEVTNSLAKVDRGTRSAAGSITVGDQPAAIAFGDGSVWVANALGKSIWRIDPLTLKKTGEVSLSVQPTTMAFGFGLLWVTSTIGNAVVAIDPARDSPVATIPLQCGPRGIATGAGAIWVACSRDALVRIDPGSRKVDRTIALPGSAEGVAVSGDSVWVTVQR